MSGTFSSWKHRVAEVSALSPDPSFVLPGRPINPGQCSENPLRLTVSRWRILGPHCACWANIACWHSGCINEFDLRNLPVHASEKSNDKQRSEHIMAPESAFIMLLLGIGGTAYLWVNRQRVREVPHCRWLIAGYGLMLTGALAAGFGGGHPGTMIDLLEAMGLTGSTLALCYWCRLTASTMSDERL